MTIINFECNATAGEWHNDSSHSNSWWWEQSAAVLTLIEEVTLDDNQKGNATMWPRWLFHDGNMVFKMFRSQLTCGLQIMASQFLRESLTARITLTGKQRSHVWRRRKTWCVESPTTRSVMICRLLRVTQVEMRKTIVFWEVKAKIDHENLWLDFIFMFLSWFVFSS